MKAKEVFFEHGLLSLTLLPDLSNSFEFKARIVGSLFGNGGSGQFITPRRSPLVKSDPSPAAVAESLAYCLRYVIANDLSNAATEVTRKNVVVL